VAPVVGAVVAGAVVAPWWSRGGGPVVAVGECETPPPGMG